MKIPGITSLTILWMVLGTVGPAYAQQEQHGVKQNQPDQQGGHNPRLATSNNHGSLSNGNHLGKNRATSGR